jgi:hypothetical protein
MIALPMVKAEKPLSFHTDCKATTNASIYILPMFNYLRASSFNHK